jgi:hypothetical protein
MGGGGADKSAKKAMQAQMAMMEKAIADQRAAYGEAKGLLNPYSEAGLGGLNSYLALLGQSGADAQRQAIEGLEQMPGYQAQLGAGQRSIMQNASATGGLRGGNVQQGLAEFGSGLFGQYYQNQLNQLGQLQQQGANTNTNLANIRAGNAANIANQYNMMGQAQGQGILAQGAAAQKNNSAMIGGLGALGGMMGGGGGGGALGGAASGAAAGSAFGPWGMAIGGTLGALQGK